MDKEKTGSFIKEMRQKNNLTQKQLADALSVTNKAVSRWETGNSFPDITLLDTLAEVLHVKIEELVVGEIIGVKVEDSMEENTVSEALEMVVQEAKKQKKSVIKILLNLFYYFLLGCFFVMILAIAFLAACFFFIGEEINIEEAQFICALGFFAIGLLVKKYGLSLLGIAIPGLILNNSRIKNKVVKGIMFAIVIFSGIMLIGKLVNTGSAF